MSTHCLWLTVSHSNNMVCRWSSTQADQSYSYRQSGPAGGALDISNFPDDTTVVGLITDNDETAYGEEVRDLTVWCQDNNISLNVIKTTEMIVDYRKR